MKWKIKPVFNTEWHRWFAWFPIEYQGDAYWLCWVERRYDERLEGYIYSGGCNGYR